ncbi:MAG: hypothetical protein JRI34_04690, partial [Deltaproteobacteria bacterium]|nr:hypothetical protein [Deltaproteobacteria bacterium]
ESDFRRVAKVEPKLAAFAMYHLALVSYKKDNFTQAKERLGKAIDLNPEPALLQQCQKFLVNIKAEERARRPASAMVTAFLKFDDNVSNQPLESTAGVLPSGLPATDQSDWSLGGSFLGSYKLVNSRRNQFGVSYSFLMEEYEHLQSNNLKAHNLSFFYYGNRKPIHLRLSGEYGYYFADNEDKMALYGLNPGMTWVFTPTDRLDFLLNLQYRKMLDQTSNVNHYIATGVYYHDFKIDKTDIITFRAGVQYENEKPRHETSPDYYLCEFSTGMTLFSLAGFVPDLSAKYELVNYDLFSAFDPTIERKDYRWEYSVQVSKEITSTLKCIFIWTHTRSKSNMRSGVGGQDPYRFTRNVLALVVSGTF